MNLAQALFDKGAIGPKTLLQMLSFPNPEEVADGVLYKMDPMAYMQLNFPEYAQQLQASQQQQAQQQMMNQAQGTAMNEQAKTGTAPEGITEPEHYCNSRTGERGIGKRTTPTINNLGCKAHPVYKKLELLKKDLEIGINRLKKQKSMEKTKQEKLLEQFNPPEVNDPFNEISAGTKTGRN